MDRIFLYMYKQNAHIIKNVLLKYFISYCIFNPASLVAQETTSQLTGKIVSERAEKLEGATITAIHEPTKNTFITQSKPDGYFHLFNLKPGGPYTIIVSFTGFESLKKQNYFLDFNAVTWRKRLACAL